MFEGFLISVKQLCIAHHTCILKVIAMVICTVWTVKNIFLASLAVNMISMERTGASPVLLATLRLFCTFYEAQLMVDDICIQDVPRVVTYNSPLAPY